MKFAPSGCTRMAEIPPNSLKSEVSTSPPRNSRRPNCRRVGLRLSKPVSAWARTVIWAGERAAARALRRNRDRNSGDGERDNERGHDPQPPPQGPCAGWRQRLPLSAPRARRGEPGSRLIVRQRVPIGPSVARSVRPMQYPTSARRKPLRLACRRQGRETSPTPATRRRACAWAAAAVRLRPLRRTARQAYRSWRRRAPRRPRW